MDPKHAIAPVRGIRRQNAKKMHLSDVEARKALRREIGSRTNFEPTMCGQRIPILTAKVQTLYNAEQINCDDCIIADVRRMLNSMSHSLVPKP